ncbi:GntR family transcriptional regulator [Roseobacter denitrificans]|nr:GntR family transcriptional regulator [Roseobacter denitrificans]AVL52596.1 GntR family transcriptional regulator [Roseobacter denitrificans]SFG30678.1 transcriptional regulator, GntR family [Roseobacter denitrificans OCh 114]
MTGAGATSNTQRAIKVLRDLIFSGDLSPGSDHLETELAQRLGMSRTPVREAALSLQAQGLVEVRPRRGIRVLGVSPQDMREIYDVLTVLESHAAEQAAERAYAADQLLALKTAIDEMDAALARDDRAAWARADDAFHRELVRLGGNRRIEAIVAMMADQVRRARALTLYMRPSPVRSNADHRAVFAAIAAGQPGQARALHESHRRAARDMLVDLLARHRLQRL